MCRKIRCDGESWKFLDFGWDLNRALLVGVFPNKSLTQRQASSWTCHWRSIWTISQWLQLYHALCSAGGAWDQANDLAQHFLFEQNDLAQAVFSSTVDSAPPKKQVYCSYSTILFLFGNNYPIVDWLGSKRSSHRVQPNCAISFWFRQHLVLHACTASLIWWGIFFLHSIKVQNLVELNMALLSNYRLIRLKRIIS